MNPVFDRALAKVEEICADLEQLPLDEQIELLNQIRLRLHQSSPFQEPIDCVVWVKQRQILANSYNPNTVATPEMELLETSIRNNGMSFPVVTCPLLPPDQTEQPPISETPNTTVDGFHRSTVCQKTKDLNKRMHGYLPVAHIPKARQTPAGLMAATVEFNRARGEHQTELMASLVTQMIQLGWSDKEIAKHLGMDGEELLRLKQMTGLAGLFANEEFSKAWVAFQEGDDPQAIVNLPE